MTNRKESIVTLVTGIGALVLGLNGLESYGIMGALGLACAIVCLIFSKKGLEAGAPNKMLKAGKVLGIIGLIFSIIGIVGGIICAVACGTLAALSSY